MHRAASAASASAAVHLHHAVIMFLCHADGYPMQDVVMRWKGNDSKAAVHGVNELDIPQFTIADYAVGTTVESSLTVATTTGKQ